MSKYLKEVKFTAIPEWIAKDNSVAVDLHFQKKSSFEGFDNVNMNVFVKATPNSTVEEISKLGVQQAKVFLEELLKSL